MTEFGGISEGKTPSHQNPLPQEIKGIPLRPRGRGFCVGHIFPSEISGAEFNWTITMDCPGCGASMDGVPEELETDLRTAWHSRCLSLHWDECEGCETCDRATQVDDPGGILI